MFLSYLKKGVSNTAVYTFSSLFSRGVSFIFLPYFLSQLSLEEFGIWDFYQTFFSLGILVISSCAATSMFRFFFLYKNDPIKSKAVIGNALLSVSILAGLVIMATSTWHLIDPQFYRTITGLNCALFSLFSLIIALLKMKESLLNYTLLFCSQSFCALFFTFLGIYNGYGIASFFIGTALSLSLYLPLFFMLLKKHLYFSWHLFKEQFAYSFPLLFYNMIYTGFFTIDRFIIKTYAGYELLGAYGLLWRFGGIFQMFSIALVDALQLVCCNAEHEENKELSQKIALAAGVALTTFALLAIIISQEAILIFFPLKYHFITKHLPLFFAALINLEIARIFNIGFILAKKTNLTPLLSGGALVLQALLNYALIDYGVTGICSANSAAFLIYGIVNLLLLKKRYGSYHFTITHWLKLWGLTLIYCLLLSHTPSLLGTQIMIVLSWPASLLLSKTVELKYVSQVIALLKRKYNEYSTY